jgi:hypothetical protein
MIMTATIKRIATRSMLPTLVLIAGGFVCDGFPYRRRYCARHRNWKGEPPASALTDNEVRFNVIEAVRLTNQRRSSNPTKEIQNVGKNQSHRNKQADISHTAFTSLLASDD